MIKPFITIAMPALNERQYIRDAVTSVLPNTSDFDCEVLVLDGGSIDETPAIVQEMARNDPRIKLVANTRKIQASAINLAADVADHRARYLVRADCHCTYPEDFAIRAVKSLQRSGAASIVVPMRTEGHNCMQRAVAAAQNSLLGNGGAAHRHISQSQFVEHGHHAAFALQAFREAGGYDESFTHNEDAELDYRLGKMGHKIYLDADLAVQYYPRDTLMKLARQYWNYGAGRARNLIKHRQTPRLRQIAPFVTLSLLVFGFAAGLVEPQVAIFPMSYIAACMLFGAALALRRREICLLLVGPACLVMHQAWGCGFIAHMARRLWHSWTGVRISAVEN